jgi:natural product precursor
MEKRKTIIELQELPKRSIDLSQSELADIFGGGFGMNGDTCALDCSCSDGLKCDWSMPVRCGRRETCGHCRPK